MKRGDCTFASVTNTLLHLRARPVRSMSGPTIIPVVSTSTRIGMLKQSQSCAKRHILSAASLSTAPPRCSLLFAITPTGWPSIRTSAVTTPTPNSPRSSSTEPLSLS